MTLTNGNKLLSVACGGLFIPLASISIADRADAAVVITNDPSTFLFLEKPTGKDDEPSLGGFEYVISSMTTGFRANDQYLIVGEEPNDETAIVADLGAVGDLSGTAFDFSIQHNLVGGRNFNFSMKNRDTGEISELCWGDNCPQGSTSTPILNGQPPINNYNGLQLQVRAQEVFGSSATVENLALSGLDITSGSDPLLDGTVTPFTPGTLPFDFGRVGQWILGDSLDLVLMAWELTGTVTLSRPDAATDELTKIRLAVDFVNDTRLPTAPDYAGVWWEPAHAGQGIQLGQDGDMLFGAWYVFDESGGDMWVTFIGTLSGSTMEADLYRFTGPALGDPWNNALLEGTLAGHGTFDFDSETSATFDYTLNGVEGSLDLEPFAPDATDTYTGIWWEPAKAGQGVYIGQDGDSMFGAWYVFDETGTDMWTTFAGTLTGSTLVADLVRFTGPPLGAPWNPSQINGTLAGTVTITFSSPDSVKFDYILNGETGSLNLKPFP